MKQKEMSLPMSMSGPQAGLRAALIGLMILQGVMLMALFAGEPPHPPRAIPLFGIAPFLGLSLATAAAGLVMPGASGRGFALLAAGMAALSFGPQKYFDAQFPLIWPAVLGGQIMIVAVLVLCLRGAKANPAAQPA